MNTNNKTHWVCLIRLPSGRIVSREIQNVVPFTAAARHAADLAYDDNGEVISLQQVTHEA